jgi:hypothetical protein
VEGEALFRDYEEMKARNKWKKHYFFGKKNSKKPFCLEKSINFAPENLACL